jgi:hypothetical protein
MKFEESRSKSKGTRQRQPDLQADGIAIVSRCREWDDLFKSTEEIGDEHGCKNTTGDDSRRRFRSAVNPPPRASALQGFTSLFGMGSGGTTFFASSVVKI